MNAAEKIRRQYFQDKNINWLRIILFCPDGFPILNPFKLNGISVASSIPAQSHTFLEMDHEIISTVILLPTAESFKKGCCQLQAKVCAGSTG